MATLHAWRRGSRKGSGATAKAVGPLMCHSVPVACHGAGGAEDVSGERGAKVVARHLGLERTRR